jgi:very-short-patch-repair endonuclease
MPHAAVSEQQRQRARRLRSTMTRAETLLWRYIKARRIDGLLFRRQAPMRGYVADFVCHSHRVIVELDGESHDFESKIQRDAERDAWFGAEGYTVLRFTNEDVLTNLSGVVETIRNTTSSYLGRALLSLSLPHKGGGNPQTVAKQFGEGEDLDRDIPR